MPTAKKLPSGSWRCLVYSHTEKIWDDQKQEWKDQQKYESFTSDDPTTKGKAAAELMAAQFKMEKAKQPKKQRKKDNMMDKTVTEAIDKYIEIRTNVLSPTTIQDYKCIQKNAFPGIMKMRLRDLDEDTLQAAVNAEYKRSQQEEEQEPWCTISKACKKRMGPYIGNIE